MEGRAEKLRLRPIVTVILVCSILFAINYGYFVRLKYKVHMSPRPGRSDSNKIRCKLPHGGYKAWTQGVVTVMEPKISRNCSLLFQGDKKEGERVERENKVWNSSQYNQTFNDWALSEDCEKIKSQFTNNMYTTKEELEFPLAFSINIHNNPQQIFRFLKVIYRPHNLYCLHYDRKAEDEMKKIAENVGRCLDNVIIPKRHVNVVWNCYTIMEAQLVCMRELLKARNEKYPWKYTTTLCGKELPLRTNREIVHMLKRLNGTCGLPQHSLPQAQFNDRFIKKRVIGSDNSCRKTSQDLGPVPHGIELRKSLAYFSLTPEFVQYLFTNSVAIDLYEYMKGAGNSEEHFFSSIFWMKGKACKLLLYIRPL